METPTLAIPLTFSQNLRNTSSHADAIETSCSLAHPTTLSAWNPTGEDLQSINDARPPNIAMGCADGSIYMFQSVPSVRPHDPGESSRGPSVELLVSSNTAGQLQHPNLTRRSHSRPASPSSVRSSLAPFQVTRARVVSSVSTEQVEAPKNYVDFDEEPEKLKGMLKGKSMKEKTFNDMLPSRERAGSTDRIPSASSSVARHRALSPTSSIHSAASTPPPMSPTLSSIPTFGVKDPSALRLSYKLYPPLTGVTGHEIAAIKPYSSGRFMICLQRTGCVSVHVAVDGSCIAGLFLDGQNPLSPNGLRNSSTSSLWTWKFLHIISKTESDLVVVYASKSSISTIASLDAPEDNKAETRLVLCQIQASSQEDGTEMALEVLCDWVLDGVAEAFGVHQDSEGLLFIINVSSSNRLLLRHLSLADVPSPSESDKLDTGSNNALPILNPFKALTALSKERIIDPEKDGAQTGLQLGKPIDLGDIPLQGQICGMRFTSDTTSLRIAYWTETDLVVVDIHRQILICLFSSSVQDVQDILWNSWSSFTIFTPTSVKLHKIIEVTADNDTILPDSVPDDDRIYRPTIERSVDLPEHDCFAIIAGNVLVSVVEQGRRIIQAIDLTDSQGDRGAHSWWKARNMADGDNLRITAQLPNDLDLIILGYSDGYLRLSSFTQITGSTRQVVSAQCNAPLPGEITHIDLVENDRTKHKLIIGGADDGSIALWTLESLELRAHWTVFTTRMIQSIHLRSEQSGRLKGCVLCIAQDGTIAVIAIDGFQFLFLVPGAISPLTSVHVEGDNMLLQYSDRARLWDTKNKEFRRTMNLEKAAEMLKQSVWVGWDLRDVMKSNKTPISTFPRNAEPSTMILDIESLIRYVDLHSSSLNNSIEYAAKLRYIRSALSALLTFGLSKEIDRICVDLLKIDHSRIGVGFTEAGSTVAYSLQSAQNAWCVSPEVSALRSLAIVSMLQVLMHQEDLLTDATTIVTFYVASLTEAVGHAYRSPSLQFLAKHWLRTLLPEVKNAARMLFEASVARLTDEETTYVVHHWQPYLPSVQIDAASASKRSALAMYISGFIAIEKYSLLPTSTLTDIAKSIALHLYDETSPWRSLAIDLCSRGFQVWQQYVDAVEMLRALFILATTSRKEAISPHNLGSQARSAVLHIAATHTPLFMTTLTIDILQPRSVQHRKSVMQLVIFLIRKKPLILYSNLPRLVEAVVKSLDPNSTANRDAVLDSATDILGHVVQTFPSVDFHMQSQRLAVGTSEGAVVMYDLKTATRLYVLEGHKKRITACSFSPDGRRLVTLSLEESVVLVWKVGSSFTSFFMPGAPPRQGHSGSDPFKTLNFAVGDEARMTLAATLDNIRFEWFGDRSVRLHIRDSTLTFST